MHMYFYAFLILLLKFFVCLAFGTVYVVHIDLFESSFMSTSYGICNIVARFFIITAPMVAEIENKTAPLIILIVMNGAATIATWFLKKKS